MVIIKNNVSMKDKNGNNLMKKQNSDTQPKYRFKAENVPSQRRLFLKKEILVGIVDMVK